MKNKFVILRNKYALTAILLLIISALSFGIVKVCRVRDEGGDSFVVVTSFYPMYIATLNIVDGIDGVEIRNLTENLTGCPHDYQLSTKDLKLLDGADVLVINGGGIENFLDGVISENSDFTIINATENIDLISEDESEEHYDEDGHSHGSEPYNPHSWLSIKDYIEEVEWITKELIKSDISHKKQYELNLQNYKSKLTELLDEAQDIELKQLTAGYKSSDISVILFHEGFEYLVDMCGFTVEDIIDMDENSNLSAAQIGDIIDKVNKGNVSFILTDEIYGKKAAEAIEKECDIQVLYIDPLTFGEKAKDAYINGMNNNFDTLRGIFDDRGEK